MAAALLRRITRLPIPLARAASAASRSAAASPHSALRSTILAESNPEKIAKAFETAVQQHRTIHGDRHIYRIAIKKLARARRTDLIDRILQQQLSPDSTAPKSEGFYTRIITLYSFAGMVDHAVRTFHQMPCPPSERSFCALLTTFLDNRQLDRLKETFAKLPSELGITPGVISHNIFIRVLCLSDDLAGARQVLDEMPSRGVKPDIITYTTLLTAYLKKGDDAGYEEILEEMYANGLNLSAATYNSRIRSLCGRGRSSEAEELLDVMVLEVYPEASTFNLLIAGYFKEGRVDSAMRIFKRMQTIKVKDGREGVRVNLEIYTTIIRGLVEKGEFGPAAEICEECLAKKWAPSFDTMKGLLTALASNSKSKEAQGLAKKMKAALSGDAVAAWDEYASTFSL